MINRAFGDRMTRNGLWESCEATDSRLPVFQVSPNSKLKWRGERTRGSRRKADRVIHTHTPFCNRVTPSTSRDTGNY